MERDLDARVHEDLQGVGEALWVSGRGGDHLLAVGQPFIQPPAEVVCRRIVRLVNLLTH